MNPFFVEGLKHSFQIGTVVPSSPWMARTMTRSVGRYPSPRRILEVGAGTGAVTRAILPRLRDGDELYLLEINPIFCRHIERRVLRPFRAAHPGIRVELLCESILDAKLPGPFDIVISSLPFYAFSASMVRSALKRLVDLVAEGGELTYMHFAGVRQMKSPFVDRPRRREMRRIAAMCRAQRRRDGAKTTFVLFNILPSLVMTSKKRNGKAPPRRGRVRRRSASLARRL
jgi:phospholipid N-methyltransferase